VKHVTDAAGRTPGCAGRHKGNVIDPGPLRRGNSADLAGTLADGEIVPT